MKKPTRQAPMKKGSSQIGSRENRPPVENRGRTGGGELIPSSQMRPDDVHTVESLERGVLALLSFLGQSYKRGTISQQLYENEKTQALTNLDNLRKIDSEEDYERANLKKDRLYKNKSDVESLLSFLEESYNEGAISEKSYKELKKENIRKLYRINKLLSGGSGYADDDSSDPNPFAKAKSHTYLDEGSVERQVISEEMENDLEAGDDGAISPRNSQIQGDEESQGDYAQLDMPEFESEPMVKPISFKEKLQSYSGGKSSLRSRFSDYGNPEVTDILNSLKINPKTEKERGYDFKDRPFELDSSENNTFSASAPGAQISQQAGAMMGKIKGMFGKKGGGGDQKNQGEGETQIASASIGANANAPAPAAGGTPSWADKLPEEMTPQELAEYNKAQEERAKGDDAPAQEAPITISSQAGNSEQGGGGGGGISTAELEKVILEIEKAKVKIESLDSARTATQERIEHIMESIGEVRTMIFDKEGGAKEQEAKLDKFVEMVSDLEPKRFAKELDKRDRQIGEAALKIEKLETMTSDMAQNLNRIRGMLDTIGSLKNIATVSKDIAERSAKIDNTVSKVERLADETGRVYVELNRKLNEFTLYRGKQDIMAESLKELVNMTESISGKLDNYSTRADLTDLKKELDDAKLMINELQTKSLLASEGTELPEHIKDLQEEKEALEQILESNEEEFIEGQIKESEYKKMKDTHTKKLQVAREKLRTELAKIRQERATLDQKAQTLTKNIQDDAPVENTSGEKTQAADIQSQNPKIQENEGETNETSKPQEIPEKKSIKTKSGQGKSSTPKSSGVGAMMAPQELGNSELQNDDSNNLGEDIEPMDSQVLSEDMDDNSLEHAQEISQEEEEQMEAQEDLEEDAQEELPEEQLTLPVVQKNQSRRILQTVPQNMAKKSAPIKNAIPDLPSLSLKTQKPLPTREGSRVYDIIKRSQEGKRVNFNATASTVKKTGSQCLVKLEDESGVIYGVFSSPLKGGVNVDGVIALDAQGVRYVKISSAK